MENKAELVCSHLAAALRPGQYGMRRFAAGVISDWTADEAELFRLFFFAIFYETWGA